MSCNDAMMKEEGVNKAIAFPISGNRNENEKIIPHFCTVPKSQGDPKIVKRGPKGDPIFGKKGTQRGPFLT